ncbi:uroporphyrinogen-III synthase [Sphingomonas laterariae]|uniref:Uroporphyrinogen-III synthase n=1 Tax=Edaphosphingomonas laterariae TaxID=861865 RepID=A0A239HL32_9SPHN|nr:uroporphyrinogen-III synthase [Sphingomonas laterariae]SNS81553.1 uroporphyrinogen-III synthase [Sphingomonas laterariae]
MRPLLILRPEPAASETAARAAAFGLASCVAPLFTVAAIPWSADDPAAYDVLMLTSVNALRHGGAQLAAYHGLPVFAVGEATATAARAAGFTRITAGDRDIHVLLAMIAAAGHAHVLHLAGREHREVDHPALRIVRKIVYAADPVDGLPGAAREALAGGAVAMLHSPRAAARFAALAPDRGRTRIAAISPAAARAAGEGWAQVAVAERPDDAALLAAAAGLCDQAG